MHWYDETKEKKRDDVDVGASDGSGANQAQPQQRVSMVPMTMIELAEKLKEVVARSHVGGGEEEEKGRMTEKKSEHKERDNDDDKQPAEDGADTRESEKEGENGRDGSSSSSFYYFSHDITVLGEGVAMDVEPSDPLAVAKEAKLVMLWIGTRSLHFFPCYRRI